MKVAEVAPAATMADTGTVNAALLLEMATDAPPTEAAPVNVTVQALDAFGPRLDGIQLNVDTRTGAATTVMVPPVPLTDNPVALGKAPSAPLTEIGIVEPPAAKVPTVTVATVPLAIVALFMPTATHITAPATELQVRVLLAAASTGPAVTAIDPILPGAYPIVHCRPDGALPPETLRDRFSGMELP